MTDGREYDYVNPLLIIRRRAPGDGHLRAEAGRCKPLSGDWNT